MAAYPTGVEKCNVPLKFWGSLRLGGGLISIGGLGVEFIPAGTAVPHRLPKVRALGPSGFGVNRMG